MNDINKKAVQAANDKQLMDSFIQENEFFIIKCASAVVHHYISKSDDEYSIALFGFSQAVMRYSIDKGSFINFAELVIRRKLIDYIRKQTKHQIEISVNPDVFDGSSDDAENLAMSAVVSKKMVQAPENTLKLEIEAANQTFSTYGFSFFDLTGCSPKAEKTKQACAKAVIFIIRHPVLLNELKKSKLLPIKTLEKNTNIPRKILERHRKYIIAATEIITGDYPCLADYMQFIKKEL